MVYILRTLNGQAIFSFAAKFNLKCVHIIGTKISFCYLKVTLYTSNEVHTSSNGGHFYRLKFGI